MIAHTSGACVQSLANSPRPKKRDDSLLVPSPHQHLYDNQPVKGLVMDTQASPAIPSGLTVIHPARRKSSAAVRRLARERQQAERARSTHRGGSAESPAQQISVTQPPRNTRVPQQQSSGRIFSPIKYIHSRLGRRGMLLLGLPLLTLAALIVLGAITLLAPQGAQAGTSQQTTAVTKVVTVKAEQTLWDIAHEADPETDPRDTIVRIIKLNDLQNTKLQAGQRLEVPAR